MRNLLSLLLACLTAVTLTGCGLKSGEDLYQLPKASAEYESLQTCLEDILDQGLSTPPPSPAPTSSPSSSPTWTTTALTRPSPSSGTARQKVSP